MRIIRFSAENVKRLGLVEIFPKGNVVKISGKNGSGKTSILDAIMWALCGTSTTPKQVVRKGQKKAIVQLDLEELVVTRTWYDGDKNGELLVQNKGTRATYPSPQRMLDALMGKVTFDPLEFIRMKAADQLEVLKGLVKLNIDLNDWKANYDRDYAARREAKKDRQRLETERDAIKVVEGLPQERRDEEALVREMTEASEYNQRIDGQERTRIDEDRQLEDKRSDVKEAWQIVSNLRKELAEEERRANELEAEAQAMELAQKKRKPLDEKKNLRDLGDALNNARMMNAEITKREVRDSKQRQVEEAQERWNTLDASLAEMEKQKAAALAEAHFPVEGLGFGDDEVLYNGLSFAQASNAEQIRVSAAIGMAGNPQIRVMRVKDGGLLDEESQAALEQLCGDQDFQLWEEVVDTTGTVGVYLVDGEVKAINEPAPEAPEKPARKPRVKKVTNGK